MCLLILSKPNKRIPTNYLWNGFNSNPHGCGISWVENGQLQIHKGMWKWPDFLANYEKVAAVKDTPVMVHFRLATGMASRSSNNCHPFLCTGGKGNDFSLGHNGMIPIKENIKEDWSDTHTFAKQVVEQAIIKGCNPVRDNWFHWLVEEAIGMGNKIVILSSTGEFVILNQDSGTWDDDVWYSCKYGYKYSSEKYSSNNNSSKKSCGLTKKEQEELDAWCEKFNARGNRKSEFSKTQKIKLPVKVSVNKPDSVTVDYIMAGIKVNGNTPNKDIKEFSGIPDFYGKSARNKEYCERIEEQINVLMDDQGLSRIVAIGVLEKELGHDLSIEEDYIFKRKCRPANEEDVLAKLKKNQMTLMGY